MGPKVCASGVLASLLLSACASNDGLPEPTPMTPAEAYRVVAEADGCPGFAGLNVAALPHGHWTYSPDTSLHRRLRPGQAASSEGQIRFGFQGFSGHHSSFSGSLVASRETDGRWKVDDVGQVTNSFPPPPPPPGSGPTPTPAAGPTRYQREWSLSVDDSQRVDGILAGRCFYAEPRLVELDASCFSRWVGTVEVVRGSVRVAAEQRCARGGTVGELMDIFIGSVPA